MAYGRYDIDYERAFTFSAPIEAVWDALAHVERFPSWWRWLHDFHVDGDALAAGAVLRGVVVPPIPFRMRLRVVIDDAKEYHHVAAIVHGDLEGLARIDLEPAAAGTLVIASWNVEMMQPPMRLAVRLGAGPLLRMGHDRVVDMTVASFRRKLMR